MGNLRIDADEVVPGVEFGRLTVVCELPGQNRQRRWLCRCECGGMKEAYQNHLLSGKCRSCGCLRREVQSAKAKTHGLSRTPLWDRWIRARLRHRVCPAWEDVEAFRRDVGEPPSPDHVLCIVDPERPFGPDNFEWRTPLERGRIAHNAHLITIGGVTLTLSDWARRTGIARTSIYERLKLGWTIEQAVSTPVLKTWNRKSKRGIGALD